MRHKDGFDIVLHQEGVPLDEHEVFEDAADSFNNNNAPDREHKDGYFMGRASQVGVEWKDSTNRLQFRIALLPHFDFLLSDVVHVRVHTNGQTSFGHDLAQFWEIMGRQLQGQIEPPSTELVLRLEREAGFKSITVYVTRGMLEHQEGSLEPHFRPVAGVAGEPYSVDFQYHVPPTEPDQSTAAYPSSTHIHGVPPASDLPRTSSLPATLSTPPAQTDRTPVAKTTKCNALKAWYKPRKAKHEYSTNPHAQYSKTKKESMTDEEKIGSMSRANESQAKSMSMKRVKGNPAFNTWSPEKQQEEIDKAWEAKRAHRAQNPSSKALARKEIVAADEARRASLKAAKAPKKKSK